MNIYTEHFETIFSTKQNIPDLRNKVLELAIQGKLVKQDPNDEPVSELLKKNNLRKERLTKENKIPKKKKFPEINDKEIPFKIPKSWKWVRLAEIINIKSGKGLTKKKMTDGVIPVYGGNGITGYHCDSNVLTPTIIIGRVGFYCGSVHITKGEAWVTDNAFITSFFEEELDIKYIASLLKFMKLGEHSSSTAQPVISGKSIYPMLAPIPPLMEQKRIVAKIEELNTKIDVLENYFEKKEQLQKTIPKAVVSAISNCQSKEALKVEMALIIEHFSDIFQTPESLQELREMILQLGIQGKLLPQNSHDEPARKLLERIELEKKQLIQDKIVKKEKKMPEIEKEEEPFEIPNSWEWVRLSDVTNYGNNTTVAPENIKDEDWILELEDIEKKSSKILKVSYNKERKSKSNKNRFSEGDVLYGKLRPYLKKVVVAPDVGLCTTEIIAFRGYCDISSSYLVNYFKTPFADNYINSVTYGMKMPRLGTKDAELLLVPLPPVEEQRRIVAKIESLMKLIDQMESIMSRKVRLVKTMATV